MCISHHKAANEFCPIILRLHLSTSKTTQMWSCEKSEALISFISVDFGMSDKLISALSWKTHFQIAGNNFQRFHQFSPADLILSIYTGSNIQSVSSKMEVKN